MSMTIASTPDAALLPAAAVAAPSENGVAATKKALDHAELMGREAVKLIEKAEAPHPAADPAKGTRVERVA